MKKAKMEGLLQFVERLTRTKIYHTLSHHREGAIMVEVVVPGARWEVEFMGDGEVEVEIFESKGTIYGREKLTELFKNYSD